jgi:hypothetical protein
LFSAWGRVRFDEEVRKQVSEIWQFTVPAALHAHHPLLLCLGSMSPSADERAAAPLFKPASK